MGVQNPRPGGRHSRSKQVALGGLMGALAIVFMLMGGFIPIAVFSAPIFASLCLIPLLVEMGTKFALLGYLTVGILSLLLVPDQEVSLFFLLLTGYYPILQPFINRIKNRFLRCLPKLLLFNGAVAAVYFILTVIFVNPAVKEELAASSWWFWVVLLVAGNFLFFIYDFLIDTVRIIYVCKLRKKIFR